MQKNYFCQRLSSVRRPSLTTRKISTFLYNHTRFLNSLFRLRRNFIHHSNYYNIRASLKPVRLNYLHVYRFSTFTGRRVLVLVIVFFFTNLWKISSTLIIRLPYHCWEQDEKGSFIHKEVAASVEVSVNSNVKMCRTELRCNRLGSDYYSAAAVRGCS